MNSRLNALAALVLVASQLQGRPITPVKVADLVSKADLIVVGQITVTSQKADTTLDIGTEKIPSRVLSAQLLVHEALKGTPSAPELTVRFLVPYEFIGYPTPAVGVSRIFFLNDDGGGYSFTSPYRPSIGGITASALPEDGVLLDRLVGHVRAVIESADTGLSEKREAIYALSDIPEDAATQALEAASHLTEPTLRVSAVAALLMRNDITAFQIAADALLDSANSPPLPMRQNLLAGISEGVRDPRAIPALEGLLRAGDDPVRAAAASAMRHTGSPNAIAALTRALDDTSAEVRRYAIIGLAEITGQPEWRPNTFDLRDREAAYLNYWKQWAKSR